MSHELRTPLNSIIGFSSVLFNEWVGPVNAEQKGNLSIILRSGKHLLNLINDVIDVSKIEAGEKKPLPSESMEEGTAFRLYFPLIIGEPVPDEHPVSPSPRGGTETILLAEDDATVREVLDA